MKKRIGSVMSISLIMAMNLGCNSGTQGGNGEDQRKASQLIVQAIDAMKANDWDAAIGLCDQALKLDPSNVTGWWTRGLAHLQKKEHDKAIEDCTEAVKLDDSHAPSLRDRGLAYLGKKDHDKAIADFTAYLKIRPTDPEVYEFRALTYHNKGDQAKSSDDLRKARELKQPGQ